MVGVGIRPGVPLVIISVLFAALIPGCVDDGGSAAHVPAACAGGEWMTWMRTEQVDEAGRLTFYTVDRTGALAFLVVAMAADQGERGSVVFGDARFFGTGAPNAFLPLYESTVYDEMASYRVLEAVSGMLEPAEHAALCHQIAPEVADGVPSGGTLDDACDGFVARVFLGGLTDPAHDVAATCGPDAHEMRAALLAILDGAAERARAGAAS